jgi:tRNA threonylcarbamoyladenosine biosynthesis protein TsaB
MSTRRRAGSKGELLLAFDTSSRMGSVALARGPRVLAAARLLRAGEHAAELVPAIGRVLREAGFERSDLQGVVVGKGPGSFTGVRIAAATAKGLAAGLGVPLWAWSSLAGAAASQRGALGPHALSDVERGSGGLRFPEEAEGWPRFVLMDARERRVYAACYRILPDRMEAISEPRATTVDDILDEELPANVLFCGEGALRHASLIEGAGYPILPPPMGLPSAEGLLRVHRLNPGAPPLPPESRWEPDYLRPSRAGVAAAGRAEAS